MSFSFVVEVVATPETENTERGAVLERFAKRFLETQGFKVKERLRLTGTEVDLLGTDPDFGESVLVECKAHRSTIPAPVLFQLLGTVQFKGYSAGWLLTTSQLGKDAKGVEQEWSERATGERRHLRLYSPDVLVQRLIQARVIKDPEGLMIDRERLRVSNDAHLLLSQKGEFWAIPILDRESGIQSSALLFNAETGCRITSATTLEWIERTDKSLLLPFLADEPEAQATASERLKTELESIVSVPTADHWADYWPENHSAIRTTSVSESRITRCNPVVGNDGRQPESQI